MTLLDSKQTPLFVNQSPDYGQSLRLWQTWKTSISAALDGSEQRTALRTHRKSSIAYVRTYQRQSMVARRIRIRQEMSVPIVVPLWPFRYRLVSVVGDEVELTRDLSLSAFKPGCYACFEESGLTTVFRLIEGVDGSNLNLASGDAAYPVITPPSYSSAAVVIPCVLGVRNDNTADMTMARVDQTTETLFVEEL